MIQAASSTRFPNDQVASSTRFPSPTGRDARSLTRISSTNVGMLPPEVPLGESSFANTSCGGPSIRLVQQPDRPGERTFTRVRSGRALHTRDSSPLRFQSIRIPEVPGARSVPAPTWDGGGSLSSSLTFRPPQTGYSATNGSIRAIGDGSFQAKAPQALTGAKFTWQPQLLDLESPSLLSTSSEKFLRGNSCAVLEKFASRYETTGIKLGSGKHSHVIQVESKIDGCMYAAKAISLAATTEDKIRREATAMAKIQHRNSSQLVDVLHSNEQLPNVATRPPYILLVMKHIDGEPLSGLIIRNGPNPNLAYHLLYQIADVLATMHRNMFVHRDIWSENILVDRNCNMYLVDFGCVEVCNSPSEEDALNIPYLSPTTSNNSSFASPSDDMWSLGLVLTEVVTGKPVMYRMGRSDVPFYSKKDLFQKALSETLSQGGPFLHRICKGLLASSDHERMRADEVLKLCAAQPPSVVDKQLKTPRCSASGTPFLKGKSSTPRHRQGQIVPQCSTQPGTMRVGPGRGYSHKQPVFQISWVDSLKLPAPELVPGQTVIYEASSHKGVYTATVVGRAAYKDAWLIELQVGGMKEVSDADSWRITPL